MLVRDLKRLALIVGPIFFIVLISLTVWGTQPDSYLRGHVDSLLGKTSSSGSAAADDVDAPLDDPVSNSTAHAGNELTPANPLSGDIGNGTHHEIFSISTPDRKYFEIKFGDKKSFNPNVIPHPIHPDTWIMVSQAVNGPEKDPVPQSHVFNYEISCNAAFIDGKLQCLDLPNILPVSATSGENCKDDLVFLSFNVGPHDARVFYGPKTPYIVYGSNSAFTCFSQWIQDFRVLVDWGFELFTQEDFRVGKEMQRPGSYSLVEKNWFVFWDGDNQMYVHHDVVPSRKFAKLGVDGSVGKDLGPLAAETDNKCIARYFPKLPEKLESIHQATNSLRITMCKRADPACKPDDSNTFIFTIFQHKTFYDFHSEYDPYVMVFRQSAPFEMYGVSQKPFWIHGRKRINEKRTDMMYVTSMSWKMRGLKYHGYLDDTVILSFGVEDKTCGGIDVLAGDLLMGLGLCSTP
ncbi:hypothetical protein B0T17DRAFT_507348 [Bombardia bombarda]|uniref:Uncharacterized protein n=1 Tax=Bombardia bombarda TaxID=252184 RepID=A0AA39XCX5_9PEZI|nr:hypothetical protein B0T17DRAFT_507348 [Bombardia bombarda]